MLLLKVTKMGFQAKHTFSNVLRIKKLMEKFYIWNDIWNGKPVCYFNLLQKLAKQKGERLLYGWRITRKGKKERWSVYCQFWAFLWQSWGDLAGLWQALWVAALWQLELEPWLPLEGRCLSSWLACQPNPIVVNPGPCCLSVCTIPAHLSSSRALFLPFSSPPTSTLRPEACDLFVFSRLLCKTWGRKKRKCLFFTCEPTISF